jgi:hypothetical protein
MVEERTVHLINADLDGELEMGEREELEGILESSAEARAMRAELLRLSNLLNSLPEQSPPPGLSNQILNQLAPPMSASRSFFSGLFASFQPVTAGLAFAAGLLFTVGFYEMSPEVQPSGDAATMVGTMVAGGRSGPGLLQNDLLLRGDGFTGTVSLTKKAGIYALSFDLRSEGPTEIQVGLDHTGLAYGGFAETPGEADQAFDSVAISGGTLRVVNQGRQQFTVFLRENSPEQVVDTGSITISFSSVGDHPDEGAPHLS